MNARRLKRWWHLATLAGLLLGLYLVYRGLSHYSLAAVMRALRSEPLHRIALAGLFAAASYLCLTVGDWLGLRYLGHRLSWRRTALAAFVSLGLGHSIGFSGLSSGAIRYRFYSRWGLSAGTVARLVLFSGVTVGLGMMILGAIVLLAGPDLLAARLHLNRDWARALGVGLALCALLYLGLAFWRGGTMLLPAWRVELPRGPYAVGQALIGTVDYLCVAACLYEAVSAFSSASYVQVASAYIVGNSAALIVHVPGGLGVIEGTILYLLPHRRAGLIGAVILFRAVYYLLALFLALIVLAAAEWSFAHALRSGRGRGRPNVRSR